MDDRKSLKSLLAAWGEAVAGKALPQPPAYEGPDVMLTDIVEHSGKVTVGSAFVARVRSSSDGHPYIAEAASRGASLILGQREQEALPEPLPPDVVYLRTADTALAAAWLAAAWEGFPGRELVMVGVTGTDGKTTTANMVHAVLDAAGLRAGLLSTIRAVIGGEEEPLALHVTTPEAPVVQRYLRRMVDAGLTHCVLETTSHGLEQHRVAAIEFDVAVVTNITHEHLDYHGSYDNYFRAKARLFWGLTQGAWALPSDNPHKGAVAKTAVLNRDDGSYDGLAAIPVPRQLTYGMDSDADVSASGITYGADATRFQLHLPQATKALTTSFVGEFNIYNMLAAAGAAQSLGISAETIVSGLQSLRGLSGRMERIDEGQPFLTIVDFAHTPNSMEKVLAVARELVPGRVITVFGSAGKRDVAKRRLMAEAAARDGDLAILTAEDPRTESLDEILAMMAEGCRRQGGMEGETFWRIPDRGRAIYRALAMARPEDVVLVCGKGHEQSMCFGTTEFPWDDRDATRAALRAFLTGEQAPDLGLPTYVK